MNDVDTHRRELAPWMNMLVDCETIHGSRAAAHSGRDAEPTPLARARRVLTGLHAGVEAPVPAWIGASERLFDSAGRVRDARPAQALRQMWLDRDALLRLGIWGGLRRLAQRCGAGRQGPAAFDALMASISASPSGLPHGLCPSQQHGGGEPRATAGRGFAASPAAAEFFNHRLRNSLRNLAGLYDGRGAGFQRWLLPDYEPGVTPLQPWSDAWTVAVVATYVDWLNRASGGSLVDAMDLCWHANPKRFRPARPVIDPGSASAAGVPRPAALPTDADHIHFDLVTQLVLAQVLDYDAGRWSARRTGQVWFGVPLSIKSLGQFDQRRKDPHLGECRNFTRYRGLTVEQIYMAVVIDRLDALEPGRHKEMDT